MITYLPTCILFCTTVYTSSQFTQLCVLICTKMCSITVRDVIRVWCALYGTRASSERGRGGGSISGPSCTRTTVLSSCRPRLALLTHCPRLVCRDVVFLAVRPEGRPGKVSGSARSKQEAEEPQLVAVVAGA